MVSRYQNYPIETTDSSEVVKSFFDNYFQKQVVFPSNQVDAVVGYFLKRGFDDQSAKSVAIVLLNQAKIDKISPFQLIDTLEGITDSQLTAVVAEVLNAYRDKTSSLGFKSLQIEPTFESRNIRP